jgi:hypothetical protein
VYLTEENIEKGIEAKAKLLELISDKISCQVKEEAKGCNDDFDCTGDRVCNMDLQVCGYFKNQVFQTSGGEYCNKVGFHVHFKPIKATNGECLLEEKFLNKSDPVCRDDSECDGFRKCLPVQVAVYGQQDITFQTKKYCRGQSKCDFDF